MCCYMTFNRAVLNQVRYSLHAKGLRAIRFEDGLVRGGLFGWYEHLTGGANFEMPPDIPMRGSSPTRTHGKL